MARMPSMMHKSGWRKSHKSTSISEKGCFSGKRQWSSGFCRPGTAPNRFFTAPEKPTMPWVFSLHRSMR